MNTKFINLKVKTSDGKKHLCTISEKGLYTNFFHDKEFASFEFPPNWWGEGLDWNEFTNSIESSPDADLYWESLVKRQLYFITLNFHNFKNN
jgi:hypothetical protein